MSLCPAFHCSRCGFAHADECAPVLKKATNPNTGLLVGPSAGKVMSTVGWLLCPCGRQTKNQNAVCNLCASASRGFTPPSAPAVPQPATRTKFIIPQVGSIWTPELRYSANDPWQPGNTLYEYMVVANLPNYQVEVDTVPAGGHGLMPFDSDHFLPAGKFEGSCYLRFIFVR